MESHEGKTFFFFLKRVRIQQRTVLHVHGECLPRGNAVGCPVSTYSTVVVGTRGWAAAARSSIPSTIVHCGKDLSAGRLLPLACHLPCRLGGLSRGRVRDACSCLAALVDRPPWLEGDGVFSFVAFSAGKGGGCPK